MGKRQLKMFWENDGILREPQIGEDFKVVTFNELEGALEAWLDIVQYGLSEGLQGADYYDKAMLSFPTYDPNYCFFVLYKGAPIATITTVFDHEEKGRGLIHMVACKEGYRGLNIGNLLASVAEYHLKKAGMKTAHLSTDDWRLPAIKTYLNIGFKPYAPDDEFKERWEKIMENINNYKK